MSRPACGVAFRFSLFSKLLLTCLLTCFLALSTADRVQAFVPHEGDFLLERSCEARPRLRGDARGPVYSLPGGSVFAVEGLNRPEGRYLRIRTPDLPERALWIARDCGRLVADQVGEPREPGNAPHGEGIFGTLVPEPQLGRFDEAVLAICGAWGSQPEAAGFRALFEARDLAPQTRQIRAELGSRIRGRQYDDPEEFAEALTQVWFAANGFAHIFCGEPGPDRLGGLHYKGRLRQAERAGWIARIPCRAETIAPPLVSLGLAWQLPDGAFGGEACPKSFSTELDAAALLVTVTRAFEAKKRNRPGEAMCLYPLGAGDATQADTLAVLVTRGGAIRTFYPSARPRCDAGGPPDNCLCMH